MYSEGEYVIYGMNGVCRVNGITTLDFDDVPKDLEYYVLFSENNGGKIYVPVDIGESNMRRTI